MLADEPAGADRRRRAHAEHAGSRRRAACRRLPASTDDLRGAVNAYEKALLEEALARNRFNQRATAAALGLSYDQLRHALKRHKLLDVSG